METALTAWWVISAGITCIATILFVICIGEMFEKRRGQSRRRGSARAGLGFLAAMFLSPTWPVVVVVLLVVGTTRMFKEAELFKGK